MDMAREAAATYYHVMAPDGLGFNITTLKAFLTNDLFYLSLTPAPHLYRLRVTIRSILCPKFDTGIKGSRKGAVYQYIFMSSDGQRFVRESLESLEKVQHKSGFWLTIVLGDGIWGAWTENTMEELSPVYYKYQQAGMRTRIYGRPSREDLAILLIERYYTMPRGFVVQLLQRTASGERRGRGRTLFRRGRVERERVHRFGVVVRSGYRGK
jgi:hypothetical protein